MVSRRMVVFRFYEIHRAAMGVHPKSRYEVTGWQDSLNYFQDIYIHLNILPLVTFILFLFAHCFNSSILISSLFLNLK